MNTIGPHVVIAYVVSDYPCWHYFLLANWFNTSRSYVIWNELVTGQAMLRCPTVVLFRIKTPKNDLLLFYCEYWTSTALNCAQCLTMRALIVKGCTTCAVRKQVWSNLQSGALHSGTYYAEDRHHDQRAEEGPRIGTSSPSDVWRLQARPRRVSGESIHCMSELTTNISVNPKPETRFLNYSPMLFVVTISCPFSLRPLMTLYIFIVYKAIILRTKSSRCVIWISRSFWQVMVTSKSLWITTVCYSTRWKPVIWHRVQWV